MAYQALITDLNGIARKYVGDYEELLVTRRLGDYAEFALKLDVRDSSASEALISERCLKLYGPTGLIHFGQVWEPLEINEGFVTLVSRDPFAGLSWRRVREAVTYTSVDGIAIAGDRIAVQNALRDTFLMVPSGAAVVTQAATLTDDSAVITVEDTSELDVGWAVSGPGIPAGAEIVSIDTGTQVTLSVAANTLHAVNSYVNNADPNPDYIFFIDGGTSTLSVGMSVSGFGTPVGATIVAIIDGSTVQMSANATGEGVAIPMTYSVANPVSLDFSPMASVVRTVSYDQGKREDEIIKELSAMSGGYFFRVDPVDGVPGKMGTLRLLYPDAGTTREEVRFGYGADTVDNLTGFSKINMLPLTRLTVSSQDPEGGRIAAAAENEEASAQYGLFEDELAFTDVDDTTLLQATADAGLRPTPPVTITLTPGPNAPLLFVNFDVGDFVRLNIGHGEVAFNEWVRVIEAGLRVDKAGQATLASLTVETLSGSRVNQDPARLFRALLDGQRSRLEALERRVQEITTIQAAPPAPPTSSGGDDTGDSPSETTPPPPPPPAPPPPPVVTSLSAEGQNFMDGSTLRRGVLVTVGVDGRGLGTTVTIDVGGATATLGGSGQVFIAKGPGGYTVTATVTTSAGSASASTSATVPSITAF